MADPTTLIIDGLATYRLSKLIARDTIPLVAKPRERWYARFPLPGETLPEPVRFEPQEAIGTSGYDKGVWVGKVPGLFGGMTRARLKAWGKPGEWTTEGSAFGEVVNCSACNSVYIGAGVVLARRFAPRVWDPIAKLLAFSAVAVRLSDLEPEQ